MMEHNTILYLYDRAREQASFDVARSLREIRPKRSRNAPIR